MSGKSVVPFRSTDTAGGGSGPEDPMIEQRVARLETKIENIEGMLVALQPKLVEMIAEVKALPKASDFASLRADVGRIDGRIDQMDKRLGMIPNTWQIIGILIALGGLLFAARYFWSP
jgi:hypothetical protein